MIVLDTKVLSEVLRPIPEPRILAWLASWPGSALVTTAVTRGEIFNGVRFVPEGRRRDALLRAVRGMFDEDFAGQVLAFDSDAAGWSAEIAAARKAGVRPISQLGEARRVRHDDAQVMLPSWAAIPV